MKFDSKKAKKGAVNTGMAVLGAVVGNMLVTNPSLSKFGPAAGFAAGIVAQGIAKDEKLSSFGMGVSVLSGIGLVNQVKSKAPASVQGMIDKFVPQLSGIEGLGNLYNTYSYTERPVHSLLGTGLANTEQFYNGDFARVDMANSMI
jgi:hypothetical protein